MYNSECAKSTTWCGSYPNYLTSIHPFKANELSSVKLANQPPALFEACGRPPPPAPFDLERIGWCDLRLIKKPLTQQSIRAEAGGYAASGP